MLAAETGGLGDKAPQTRTVLALQVVEGSLAWRTDVGPAGKPLSPPATDGERMNRLDPTERILRQGKALVRAIEALSTIDPSSPIERAAAR